MCQEPKGRGKDRYILFPICCRSEPPLIYLLRNPSCQMFKRVQRRRFKAGEVIYEHKKDILSLNLIVEGLVQLKVR